MRFTVVQNHVDETVKQSINQRWLQQREMKSQNFQRNDITHPTRSVISHDPRVTNLVEQGSNGTEKKSQPPTSPNVVPATKVFLTQITINRGVHDDVTFTTLSQRALQELAHLKPGVLVDLVV